MRNVGVRLLFPSLVLGVFGSLAQHSAQSAPADGLSIRKIPGGMLIEESGQAVVGYVRDPIGRPDGTYMRGHYLHPLYSLNGTRMSDDMPADHLHHRGIFWAWSQLWLGDQKLGQPWEQKGLVWKVRKLVPVVSNKTVTLTCDVLWNSPLVDGGKDLVHETSLITVHQAHDGQRRIDFQIELLALEEKLHIGGSEDRKGYGGFSARIPLPADIKITGPKGEMAPNLSAPSKPAPWADFSGSFDKAGISGITIFTHPANPGHPQAWTLRKQASCQNPVFPGRNPYLISTTTPLILRYSLLLHEKELDAISIEAAYNLYLKENPAGETP